MRCGTTCSSAWLGSGLRCPAFEGPDRSELETGAAGGTPERAPMPWPARAPRAGLPRSMSPSRPPQRRLLDAEELRRELHGYRSDWEDPPTRAQLVESALPRITGVLELLPDADPESRLLELGAAPFLGSQCVARVWPGELMLASYSGTGETRGSQRLLSLEGKPDKVFTFDCFNVETDEFPYPDEHFDVVIFSELIEHLGLNPVWALSEIHRVLKRGGHAIISTPNALSLERLSTYLRGGSEMVDRYAPLLGYGARHNREWHPAELRELLESTGFEIETLVVRDLGERPLKERLRRALAKR